MRIKPILCALASAVALHALPAAATEIRLARQFSMGYLQLNVMEHQQLIEKHAKALGLNDVKVSWFTFNGPTAVNEALISGNIDVGSGGVPLVRDQSTSSPGTPPVAMSMLPEINASLTAAGPLSVIHDTLRSGMPSAMACFSMSCWCSITLNCK